MMNSERTVKFSEAFGWIISYRKPFLVRVGNDREINRTVLCFIDVVSPAQVLIQGIDTDCENFHVPFGEFILRCAVLPSSVVQTRGVIGRV